MINRYVTTNNWFLLNKRRYGNDKYMFKHFFLPIFAIYSIFDIWFLIESIYQYPIGVNITFAAWMYVDAFYYLLCVIACIILYQRTPDWEDNIFIRAEMKFSAMLCAIVLSIYCLSAVILTIFYQANVIKDHWIAEFFINFFGTCFFFGYGMFLTYYPLSKIGFIFVANPLKLLTYSTAEQMEILKMQSTLTYNSSDDVLKREKKMEKEKMIEKEKRKKKFGNKLLSASMIHSMSTPRLEQPVIFPSEDEKNSDDLELDIVDNDVLMVDQNMLKMKGRRSHSADDIRKKQNQSFVFSFENVFLI